MLEFAVGPAETAIMAGWVAERIPHMHGGGFGPCVAGGVVRDGVLVAGVVFHDYHPQYGTMQVSIAADHPRWASRPVLRAMFDYPFRQLGVDLLWAAMPADLPNVHAFNRRLGFKKEAVLRRRYGGKRHAVIASMTRGEWENSPWFGEE
jgi:RimJ/RimL family protein N-acetyltransferase